MVTCVSNLKQLHQAAVNYAASNSGRLPYTASSETMSTNEFGELQSGYARGWVDWYPDWSLSNPPDDGDRLTYWWNQDDWKGIASVTNGTLFEYLGDTGDEGVYVCPTMGREARKRFSSSADRGNQKHIVTRSYGMNASVGGNRLSGIDGASRTLLFADQGFIKQVGYRYALEDTNDNWDDSQRRSRQYDGCIDWKRNTDNTYEHIGEYHGGRGNAVFADGHVESIEYDYTRYICQGAWEAGKPPPGVVIDP